MSSISTSYKNIPVISSSHLVPLDFSKVVNVPESHKWNLPSSTDHHDDDPQHEVVGDCEFTVPVIDLADPEAMSRIRDACEKWGVFQVINHGISIDVLNEVEVQTRELFSLPTERKLAALRSPSDVAGYGLPRISNFFAKLMWSEGFSIIGSPAVHAKQLWPEQSDCQTKFCHVMEEYQEEMKKLTERLLESMLTSLGLAMEDVEWLAPSSSRQSQSQSQAQAVLHLNSYPVCPNPNHAMGLAPHTDSSALTLLYQSNTSGLQVCRDDGGWTAVQPLAGALVVNLGDLLHILSNGRFKSVLHRAMVNNECHRISIAYFYGPPSSVEVAPLAKLTDPDHPPLYRHVTWKDYLGQKALYFDKALEYLRN